MQVWRTEAGWHISCSLEANGTFYSVSAVLLGSITRNVSCQMRWKNWFPEFWTKSSLKQMMMHCWVAAAPTLGEEVGCLHERAVLPHQPPSIRERLEGPGTVAAQEGGVRRKRCSSCPPALLPSCPRRSSSRQQTGSQCSGGLKWLQFSRSDSLGAASGAGGPLGLVTSRLALRASPGEGAEPRRASTFLRGDKESEETCWKLSTPAVCWTWCCHLRRMTVEFLTLCFWLLLVIYRCFFIVWNKNLIHLLKNVQKKLKIWLMFFNDSYFFVGTS